MVFSASGWAAADIGSERKPSCSVSLASRSIDRVGAAARSLGLGHSVKAATHLARSSVKLLNLMVGVEFFDQAMGEIHERPNESLNLIALAR
jgi:hypothetical protein